MAEVSVKEITQIVLDPDEVNEAIIEYLYRQRLIPDRACIPGMLIEYTVNNLKAKCVIQLAKKLD